MIDMQELNDTGRLEAIASHIHSILELLGEDPRREGLVKTPMRAAKALSYLTSGYRQKPVEVARQALFEAPGSDMIIVRDIEFYSMCEHHILPFFGKISIGYIPGDKILGLSKLARIVDAYAHRLQVQERFTSEVACAVEEALEHSCRGVMVHCNAQHMCMKMRGVEKQDSATTTTFSLGVFRDDVALRNEFLNAIR